MYEKEKFIPDYLFSAFFRMATGFSSRLRKHHSMESILQKRGYSDFLPELILNKTLTYRNLTTYFKPMEINFPSFLKKLL